MRSDQPPDLNEYLFEQIQCFHKKAAVYEGVVLNLNEAREWGIAFEPATAFKDALETSQLESSTNKVIVIRIWHLIQALVCGSSNPTHNLSRESSLLIAARRHLEWVHENYILDTIKSVPALVQSDPAQVAHSVVETNLQKIQVFIQMHSRENGVRNSNAADVCSQPPADTTWQQIYFCLRTGYYDEAINVCLSSPGAHEFAVQLHEWVSTEGRVSQNTAAAATEEFDRMLSMGNLNAGLEYDKKLILYAIISGSRKQIEWFNNKEVRKRCLRDVKDFIWFKLACIRVCSGSGASSSSTPSSSSDLDSGLVAYSLKDLQVFFNKLMPSTLTEDWKHPLVYPYIMLLTIQLLPAFTYLCKEIPKEDGLIIDSIHMLIALSDQGILSEGSYDEAASMIRLYGSSYLRGNNLRPALEYYLQAASAMGGGAVSWAEGTNLGQETLRLFMLKQLLTELLLHEDGVSFLLGTQSAREEGKLGRCLRDRKAQEQFLVEAGPHCKDALQLKQIQKYLSSISNSSSKSGIQMLPDGVCQQSTTPGSKAQAKLEFYKNEGNCLFCANGKKPQKFDEFFSYLAHQTEKHSKQYRRKN